jgi:Protein of unknown function (DUF3306)
VSEGFFSRWSRRKQEVAHPPPAQETAQTPAASGNGVQPRAPIPAPEPLEPGDGAAPPALPTLQDAQALTSESDFQPFMRTGVGAEVRNAAMKKLFADPHFNVMDGLDIYIEDYNRPDPMPAGMLQKMASAQFLKLVPPEEAEVSTPAGSEVMAQSPGTSATAEPPSHDHPDLQLQPDPSPADPSAEPDAR